MSASRGARIIDAWPAFVAWWEGARNLAPAAQAQGWLAEYMVPWPELAAKQLQDYASQGVDWRAIAQERILPHLAQRLPLMAQAHDGLLGCIASAHTRAQDVLLPNLSVLYVLHVGIGCGAGWATTLAGNRACLFGLENVAECGWGKAKDLAGLTAHELGHLHHAEMRARAGVAEGRGPFWDLYEEGFAVRCEQLIIGHESFHETGSQAGWLAWCREHLAWLAREYLRSALAGEPTNRFFGNWFDVEGWWGTGHFLGHELIRAWEGELTLHQIAALDAEAIEQRAKKTLQGIGSRA